MLTSKKMLYASVATAVAILVLAGTVAAAKQFYNQKAQLEARVATLEAEVGEVRSYGSSLEGHIADLEGHIAQLRSYGSSLEGHIAELTNRRAEEVDYFRAEVSKYREHAMFLSDFYLPTNEKLEANGYSVVQMNNPLMGARAEIRRIKKSAADLTDLWSQLKPLAETYVSGSDADLTIGAMLVVAAFYDFGNEPPNENLSGCAGNGQETGFKQVPELTFDLHMSSNIGCCTDFTMLLGSFLEYLGYESEVMTNAAHQFLRVRIGERWDLIDSTTRIYVRDYFSDEEKVIRSYAVGDDRIYAYKVFFAKALAFEIDTYGPDDWQIIPRAQQNIGYNASYLNL